MSRILNNSAVVSPDTAARVREAIKALNYMPNRNAKALVSGRSHILGIIVSDITNPFFPELIKGFENAAVAQGYEIIVASSNYDAERAEQCVRRLIQRSVDGVAIMTSEFDSKLIADLTTLKVPTVFLDVGRVGDWISNVKVDYGKGIRDAVTHLLGLGHRRIAFISGPRNLKSARVRQTSFLRAMKDKGIVDDPALVVEANHRIDGGVTAMTALLPHRPTAVLTSNDLTAIGAISAIRRAGLRIPEDISVIGFDDIELAQFTDPPLTTVRLPRAEVAIAACSAILDSIRLRTPLGTTRNVATELLVRESTGPAPAKAPALS